jgi:hypothetical protein
MAIDTKTFASRNGVHTRARAVIQPILETAGFVVDDHGAEFAGGLSELVQTQDDRCSLMLRYRPDVVCVKQQVRAVLCEIKGTNFDPSVYAAPAFTIEARALKALWEWNAGGRVAMVACVAFWPHGGYKARAVWADAIPTPRKVWVPERWDFAEQMEAMGTLFPNANLVPRMYRASANGSGTPYVMVPDSLLTDLESFVGIELLGVPIGTVNQQSLPL